MGGAGSEDAASWLEDADYNNELHTAVSDENGEYSFDNLATYVYKNGKYYLAGYKPFVDKMTILFSAVCKILGCTEIHILNIGINLNLVTDYTMLTAVSAFDNNC